MNFKQILGVVLLSSFSGALTLGTYIHFFQPSYPDYTIEADTQSIATSNNNSQLVHYSSYDAAKPTNFTEAAEKTVNAVVHVSNLQTMRRRSPFDFMYGNSKYTESSPQPIGIGSGVIISSEGYIVTNNHVINEAEEIQVKLNNGKVYDAKLVGTDTSTDIALLKIDATDLPYLKLVDSDKVKVGEWVLAVGNPFNLNSTVTAGIVSALNRTLGEQENGIESFIQTDAAVNSGNSGGALVNTNGDLIGINTAITTHNGTFEGYSFAVPTNIVQRVVKDLMEYGTVNKAYLGIRFAEVNADTAEQLGLTNLSQGIFVSDIIPNGSAERAGVKTGDVILQIDDIKTNTTSDLKGIIESKRPGDIITVTYLRDGSQNTIQAKLLNSNNKVEFNKENFDISKALGASIRPLTRKEKDYFELNKGLIIESIDGYPFSQVDLNPGDIILEINNQAVSNLDELTEMVNSNKKALLMTIMKRNGRVDYYAIRLKK